MFYIYILEGKDARLYIGYTSDIKKRLKEHNQGLSKSTKPYMSWRLVYYEACLEKTDAERRERYLKTTQGGRLIKRRIKDYLFKKRSASRNFTTGYGN